MSLSFASGRMRGSIMLLAALALMVFSADRLALYSALTRHAGAGQGGAPAGWMGQFWPLQLSEQHAADDAVATPDPAHLPPFTSLHSATVVEQQIDPATFETVSVPVRRTWVEHRFGYLWHVADKMLETIEIAAWGTLLAIVLAVPLSLGGAGPVQLPAAVRAMARSACAMLRAIPELISALFLVAALGFGPLAGICALGLYAAGFLGRFYADAIEDADQRPVEALRSSGAGRLATIRHAVLPQVRGPVVSATFYVFDRNVRMATVIGVVGAGGIGQELKGRMDTFEYHHVATILVAILIVVLLVDQLAMRLRRRTP